MLSNLVVMAYVRHLEFHNLFVHLLMVPEPLLMQLEVLAALNKVRSLNDAGMVQRRQCC